MKYCADLHIHSPYSRGTSRALSLEDLAAWARIKGVNLLGTGDFTHPAWRAVLKEKLVPDGRGFFALRDPDTAKKALPEGFRAEEIPLRFCLSAEISSIYKKNGATRKVHSLLFAPDMDSADAISRKLAAIGNIASDGRPILGLDPKHLVEIVKEVSPACHFIPAHIWTPWFSVFGAHSGFDSLEECFEDMLGEIFALETGLSSDPLMNWRISGLDRYALVSNSDAHSAAKLMREATLFDAEFGYEAMFRALKTRQGFEGTIEFFPAEGKYHLDGHRQCNVVVSPEEGDGRSRCPVCGKPLTIGVLHRVLELADRKEGKRPAGHPDFRYAIPLPEIISELTGTGPASKATQRLYREAVAAAGNERQLLFHQPLDEIRKKTDPWLALAVSRLRERKVNEQPGYDGEFGVIRVFADGELERLRGQAELWSMGSFPRGLTRRHQELFKEETAPVPVDAGPPASMGAAAPGDLNDEQRAVIQAGAGANLVLAGPGTGKTRTLAAWMAERIESGQAEPRAVCAFTFTTKARDELAARLASRLGERARAVTIATFHSFCFDIISDWYPEVKGVYDENGRRALLRFIYPSLAPRETEALSDRLEKYLDGTGPEATPELDEAAAAYQEALKNVRGVDVAGLVSAAILIFDERPEILDLYRGRFRVIAVDEFQDINRTQYRFFSRLIGPGPAAGGPSSVAKNVLVIGDPDQAIYGFRGGDASLFFRFQNDYQARYFSLSRNYRSTGVIVGAARELAARLALKSGLKLVSARPAGEKIRATLFADEQAEGEWIAALIHKLVGGVELHTQDSASAEARYSFRDIAVLARTHRALEYIIRACARHNIPTAFRSGRSFLSDPPYNLLAEVFRYFMNREDVVAFQNIVNGLVPGFSREALAAVIAAFQAGNGDPETIAAAPEVQRTLSGVERGALEALFRFLEFVEAEIESQGVGKGIFLLLEKILGAQPESGETKTAHLSLLEMAAGYGNDVARFVREVLLARREEDFGFPVERVSFLTFHAAKGLEFPVVIIAAAEEGITPHLKPGSDPDEERRLFYVALTRAGDRAFVTHAARRDFFGKEQRRTASRFIAEIPAEYVDQGEVREKKRDYSQPTFF